MILDSSDGLSSSVVCRQFLELLAKDRGMRVKGNVVAITGHGLLLGLLPAGGRLTKIVIDLERRCGFRMCTFLFGE